MKYLSLLLVLLLFLVSLMITGPVGCSMYDEYGCDGVCDPNDTCPLDCDPTIVEKTGCVNECSDGERACAGESSFYVCGLFDQDACFDWSSPISCNEGYQCEGGVCIEQVEEINETVELPNGTLILTVEVKEAEVT